MCFASTAAKWHLRPRSTCRLSVSACNSARGQLRPGALTALLQPTSSWRPAALMARCAPGCLISPTTRWRRVALLAACSPACAGPTRGPDPVPVRQWQRAPRCDLHGDRQPRLLGHGRGSIHHAAAGTQQGSAALTGRMVLMQLQPILDLDLNADGSQLVTVAEDNSIRVWDQVRRSGGAAHASQHNCCRSRRHSCLKLRWRAWRQPAPNSIRAACCLPACDCFVAAQFAPSLACGFSDGSLQVFELPSMHMHKKLSSVRRP